MSGQSTPARPGTQGRDTVAPAAIRTLAPMRVPRMSSAALPPPHPRQRGAARRDHRERRGRAPHQLRARLRRLAELQRDQVRRRLDASRGDRAAQPHLLGRDRHPDRRSR